MVAEQGVPRGVAKNINTTSTHGHFEKGTHTAQMEWNVGMHIAEQRESVGADRLPRGAKKEAASAGAHTVESKVEHTTNQQRQVVMLLATNSTARCECACDVRTHTHA